MRLPRLHFSKALTSIKGAACLAVPKRQTRPASTLLPDDLRQLAGPLYQETLRLAGQDALQLPAETPLLPAYLKAHLTRPTEADTLAVGLALTDGFVANAPDGPAAAHARVAISNVIKELSPLYAKALTAKLKFNESFALTSILAGVSVGLHERAVGSISKQLLVMSTDDKLNHVIALWPRLMIDERAALQAASLGGERYVDSLAAAATYFPEGWPKPQTPRVTQALEDRRARGPYKYTDEVAPLTHEEEKQVKAITDVCKRLGRYGIEFYEKQFLVPTNLDYRAERICLYRGFIAYNKDADINGLQAFLKSAHAKQMRKGTAKVNAVSTQDAQRLMAVAAH